MRSKIVVFLCLTVFSLMGSMSGAEGDAVEPPNKIGIYLLRLDDFNLKDISVAADFWLWVTSPDSAFTNLDDIEIINGDVTDKTMIDVQRIDSVYYASMRMGATLKVPVALEKYPFDMQKLELVVENNSYALDSLAFEVDAVNSGILPDLNVYGWVVRDFNIRIDTYSYNTSFGVPTLTGGSSFSRCTAEVLIEREGGFWQKLVKYFWAVFISTGVAILALLIHPSKLDIRCGLGVGALFANIGSSFIMFSELPYSPGITIAELMIYVSLCVIFIALVESVAVAKFCTSEQRERLLHRFDRYFAYILLVVYLGTQSAILYAKLG